MDDLTVWTTDDARAFLDRADGYLRAEPVLANVLAVVAQRIACGSYHDDLEPWFGTVSTAASTAASTAGPTGRVVGAGMHTAPNAYLGPGPAAAGTALAGALLTTGRSAAGVVGTTDPAVAFAGHWSASTGTTATVTADEGVHVLGTLMPPSGVPGSARTAGPDDVDLVTSWLHDFAAEAFPDRPPGPPQRHAALARTRIDEGCVLLWQVDGTPVSLAGRSGPAFGVGRVGPVWTPPAHRRNGYAAAVTAATCRRLLDAGSSQVMLFTDLANPTSNGVYARLGFSRVGAAVEYRFH